jgi:pimeloyl-ACP methyl ester carboxylesterase
MLRRTKTMFTRAGLHAGYFQRGGMQLFANELTNYLHDHKNMTVTIIAHSMGSIVANELIRRHGDNLRISEIVYMAAACGVEDFDRTVVPFLRRHPQVPFYNLCLHPVNDSSESYRYISWALEPIAPQGSLLEWIDDYYSSTETDYGRTLGKWDNAVLGTKGYLARNDSMVKQLHFKGFGVGDEETHGPQHHGGFDQMRFWDPDFWKPGVWHEGLLHPWEH